MGSKTAGCLSAENCVLGIVLVTIAICTTLNCFGLFTPDWRVGYNDKKGPGVKFGLWMACDGSYCQSHREVEGWVFWTRLTTATGVLLMLVAAVLVLARMVVNTLSSLTPLLAALFGGIFTLTGVIIFTVNKEKAFEDSYQTEHLGYSIYLCLASGIIAHVCWVLLLCINDF